MNQNISREQRRQLERDNAKLPRQLVMMTGWQGRAFSEKLIEVWRSREFLVQVYREREGVTRASINRTMLASAGDRWIDGIAWEDLQRVKREIGRGHLDAVEVFPSDTDIVNVANMRHLWILDKALDFCWRAAPGASMSIRDVHHD